MGKGKKCAIPAETLQLFKTIPEERLERCVALIEDIIAVHADAPEKEKNVSLAVCTTVDFSAKKVTAKIADVLILDDEPAITEMIRLLISLLTTRK